MGITLEVVNYSPVVHARWGGGPPQWFLLDTGATATNLIAGSPLARSALAGTLERLRTYVGSGETNPVPADGIRGCSVQLGSAAFGEFDTLVMSYGRPLSDGFQHPVVGGLGWSLFNQVLLTVDYDRRQVTIERGELPPPNGADVLPIRITRGDLTVPITIGGRQVWVTVDTCAGGEDNVDLGASDAAGLKWVRPPTTQSSTYIDGIRVGRQGSTTGQMRLGRYVIDQPMVYVEPKCIDLLSAATLRHFRVTFDVRHDRMRLEGPIDAPPGQDHLCGEAYYNTDTERLRDPRHPRWFVVAAAAARKGLRLHFDRGAVVVARPGRSLVIHPSGVLMETSGSSYRYTVRVSGVSVDGDDYSVARWYERSPHAGEPAPRVSLLNPYGTTRNRSTDPATGVTTVVAESGVVVAERPDGSTRTTLPDGVVLDWSAGGVIAISWPDAPAARPVTRPAPPAW